MPRRLQISRGSANLLRGAGQLAGLAFGNERLGEKFAQGLDDLAGGLEEGIELEHEPGRISIVRKSRARVVGRTP